LGAHGKREIDDVHEDQPGSLPVFWPPFVMALPGFLFALTVNDDHGNQPIKQGRMRKRFNACG
jgi:hypothetical protein